VADVYQNRFLENWQEITTIRKPIIAAVSGYAVKITFPFSPSSALTRKRFPPARASSAEAASSP